MDVSATLGGGRAALRIISCGGDDRVDRRKHLQHGPADRIRGSIVPTQKPRHRGIVKQNAKSVDARIEAVRRRLPQGVGLNRTAGRLRQGSLGRFRVAGGEHRDAGGRMLASGQQPDHGGLGRVHIDSPPGEGGELFDGLGPTIQAGCGKF